MTDTYETQRKKVLDWLQAGNTLTQYHANVYWGISRLAAVIQKLEEQGYVIDAPLSFEKSRHWSVYSMKKPTKK